MQLPWDYAEPRGRLVVAHVDAAIAGCVAIRPLNDPACEMRRLYVRSAYRSAGVGRKLVEQVIASARAMGYEHMLMNTLPAMSHALALYRSFGFHDVEPYVTEPNPSVIYLGLEL